MRKVLRSKIHGATVSDANLKYEGSITLPLWLIEQANMTEYEAVHVWDITNGSRFETYVIRGEEDSNDVIINGAAAHLVKIKDQIIIASFTWLTEEQLKTHKPKIVLRSDFSR